MCAAASPGSDEAPAAVAPPKAEAAASAAAVADEAVADDVVVLVGVVEAAMAEAAAAAAAALAEAKCAKSNFNLLASCFFKSKSLSSFGLPGGEWDAWDTVEKADFSPRSLLKGPGWGR